MLGFGCGFLRPLILGMNDRGGQAYRLAGADMVGRFHPLAIQPHLALAQQLLQQHMRDGRIMPLEPAVQADAVIVGIDGAQFRHRPYASAKGPRTARSRKAAPSRRYRRRPGRRHGVGSAARLPEKKWKKWCSRPECRWSGRPALPAKRSTAAPLPR